MSNQPGPALSDAATYAGGAMRLLVAARVRLDEARELEPGLERRLLIGGHLFGHEGETVAEVASSSDDDSSLNLSEIPSEVLNEFERTLLEDVIEYVDYLQRLADQFGHAEVRRRFYGRRG